MLNRISWTVIMAAIGALAAEVRQTVATITTPEAFTLSGVQVSAVGVTSWPLTIGDEVKTGTAAAVIRFEDKTQIALDKASTMSLEKVNGRITARLTAGSMRYKLAANGHIDLFARKERLQDMENGVALKGRGIDKSKGIGPPLDPPGPPPDKPPQRSQSN
jgi:hypothetical protein